MNVVTARPESSATAGLEVQSAFWIEFPAEKGSDEEIGQVVSSALKKNGIGRTDVLVVLDRDCVEVRKFAVPPVPADELPELVRMQAPTLFTAFTDEWSLDFVPVASNAQGLPTDVMAVAVSPQLLRQVKSSLEAAGLKIRSITLRTPATLDLVAACGVQTGRRLVAHRSGDDLDFVIANGKDLVLARSVKLPHCDEPDAERSKILQEFKRTLASLTQARPDFTIETLAVVDHPENCRALTEMLQPFARQDVRILDPIEVGRWPEAVVQSVGVNRVSSYAPAMGALAARMAGRRQIIDILNPRSRPKNKSKLGKVYLWAGLAAAVVFCALFVAWVVLDGQKKQIASLQTELNQLKQTTKDSDQVLGPVELIDDWKRADRNWLDELVQVSDRSLLPDDLSFGMFGGSYLENKQQVVLNTRGLLTDPEVQQKFRNGLLEVYGVESKPNDPIAEAAKLRIGDQTFYERKFEENLTIDLQSMDWELDRYAVEPPDVDPPAAESPDAVANDRSADAQPGSEADAE